MSKQTANSFFMYPPLVEYAEFYQQLLRGLVSHQQLGDGLIRLAEQANAFRQLDKVRELADLLRGLPIKEYQHIGQYYLALSTHKNGKGDVDKARRILESTVSRIHPGYKAKAILLLAAMSARKGDYDSEFYYFTEALKAKGTIDSIITAHRGMAVSKARDGYNSHALKDLENIIPLLRYSRPNTYYDFLNSYAVELGEVGRLHEARDVSRVVLASPFAFAYPEWQETAKELREPDRTFISVPRAESEPVEVEAKAACHAAEEAVATQPATVVAFHPLREAPGPQRPELIDSRELAEMSPADKREFILAAIRTDLLPESEYNKVVFMLGLVRGGAAPNVIDLEDEKVLNDLMAEWAHLIEPEELVGVLSALRDCEDDSRRSGIIDNMIRKVFECSSARDMTESEWRLQVERRLPQK
ncbi:MAG: hypothetical protein ACLGJB_18965 [Blastocatellia bacterium]